MWHEDLKSKRTGHTVMQNHSGRCQVLFVGRVLESLIVG